MNYPPLTTFNYGWDTLMHLRVWDYAGRSPSHRRFRQNPVVPDTDSVYELRTSVGFSGPSRHSSLPEEFFGLRPTPFFWTLFGPYPSALAGPLGTDPLRINHLAEADRARTPVIRFRF